jgi:hypothetical protein
VRQYIVVLGIGKGKFGVGRLWTVGRGLCGADSGGGGFPKLPEFDRLADGACTFRRLLSCVWLIDGRVMPEGTIRSPRNRCKGKADGANLRREAWTLSKETVCRRKMQLK